MSQMSLPLPPTWSEHRAPNGQLYYYNTRTQESTYIRPPPLPIPQQPPKKKKEKFVEKIHIPGTDWLRVRTEDGNVFWNHRTTKKSVWIVPEEIKEHVEGWEKSVKEAEEKAEADQLDRANEEIERIKAEVEASTTKAKGKRKGEEPVEQKENKRARVEDEKEDDEEGNEDGAEENEQRAMLNEIVDAMEVETAAPEPEEEEEEKPVPEPEPTLSGLSLQEAKILFRTLLEEQKIDPLLPWDASVPLIIRDPRYLSLPSLSLRKEVFDEYCRERARQLRMERAKAQAQESSGAAASATSGELAPETKESYLAFLKATVTSTRTNFTDFKRAHKKDRRFYSFGRDERERERVFKEWMKELGEIKRASAKVAEDNFFKLLEERVKDPGPNANWKEVKKDKGLASDPRYEAVGSSSLRQELFETYMAKLQKRGTAGLLTDISTTDSTNTNDDSDEKEKEKERRRQRALAERQSQVQSQKHQLVQNIDRSRAGLEREGGEESFRSLLTDAIRDPLTSWSSSLSHLSADPRYINSPLPMHVRQRLFHAHLDNLRQRHISSLHSLFTAHSNSIQPLGLGLDKRFSDVSPDFVRSLQTSLPVTKLDFTRSQIEREFEKWQSERYKIAQREFEELLGENNFLEFWGKVRKSAITTETVARNVASSDGLDKKGMEVKIENDDLIGEEDEDASAVDMREMAKTVDVTEVERVLKNDKRYRMFDHVPEQREQWLRHYMQSMAAPKLSVHTG